MYHNSDWLGRLQPQQLQAEVAGSYEVNALEPLRRALAREGDAAAGTDSQSPLPPPALRWNNPLLRLVGGCVSAAAGSQG
jgi:hypothetical protein